MAKRKKTTFALDIGTRTVIGILLEENEEKIIIKNIVVKEHSSRSMLDGQIHNIPQVSALVKEVKKELENKSGLKLKKVAVAAAGRSLRTIKTEVEYTFEEQQIFTKEDVLNLELKAAQKAQSILIKEKNNDRKFYDYYCVGYSVVKSYLDDIQIGSLIGQKGKKAKIEIVAAFLPKVVVDSLQSVLKENKLELSNITLEPIAAINAIIPETVRKLNVVLVDVGAGTSDIAISSDGSIVAYGMVPFAGDEITETLCEKLLLDFNEGEIIKRKLVENEIVEFIDILGLSHSRKTSEIIKEISDTIELLAKKISSEILELNGKPPQAVILIGGGSLTPLLPEFLAEYLELPNQRVAVQKAASVKNVNNLPEEYKGPDIVTPLGIGLTAIKNLTLGFIPVRVNNQDINLLNLGNNKVLDALLAAGVNTERLYGKPGLAITAEVNGKIITFPGTLGEKAIVKVNGEKAKLNTILKPKDNIEFIPAKDGKPGKGFISDILPKRNFIFINQEKRELPLEITMNGKTVTSETEIKDGAKIHLREKNQLGELIEHWELIELKEVKKITLVINKMSRYLSIFPYEILVNGKVVDLYEKINSGDKIVINKYSNKEFTLKEIINKYVDLNQKSKITIFVNNRALELPVTEMNFKRNNQKINLEYIVKNEDIIEIDFKKLKEPMLVDVFPLINFSSNPPTGKSKLEILVNGKEAEYTTLLKDGDKICLEWK